MPCFAALAYVDVRNRVGSDVALWFRLDAWYVMRALQSLRALNTTADCRMLFDANSMFLQIYLAISSLLQTCVECLLMAQRDLVVRSGIAGPCHANDDIITTLTNHLPTAKLLTSSILDINLLVVNHLVLYCLVANMECVLSTEVDLPEFRWHFLACPYLCFLAAPFSSIGLF